MATKNISVKMVWMSLLVSMSLNVMAQKKYSLRLDRFFKAHAQFCDQSSKQDRYGADHPEWSCSGNQEGRVTEDRSCETLL